MLGKLLYTADTSLRSHQDSSVKELQLAELAMEQMHTATSQFPANNLKVYHQAQAKDPVSSQLFTFCQSKWSDKYTPKGELNKYSIAKHNLIDCFCIDIA